MNSIKIVKENLKKLRKIKKKLYFANPGFLNITRGFNLANLAKFAKICPIKVIYFTA